MDINEKYERSKSTERIDFSKIGCLEDGGDLVKVESTDSIIVEPVWTLKNDFDGKMYAEYISQHPEYDGVFVRSEVLSRLLRAADSLGGKYKLVLRAGHRPVEVQKRLLELCIQDYKEDNPGVSDEAALDHARTFVDDPSLTLPSHCGGGAVDVELYDVSKRSLVDFGSPRDLDDEISYLHSNKITSKQKENRTLLLKTMLNAGFASCYSEWWHFSYGDKVWAWFYGKEHSLYDFISVESKARDLEWQDYLESEEFATKEDFDTHAADSEDYELLLSSPTTTLYRVELYPNSLFLITLGSLGSNLDLLSEYINCSVFIKCRLRKLNSTKFEKIFDSFEITYRDGDKTPQESLVGLEALGGLDEVLDLYTTNHAHHSSIDRERLRIVLESYSLQRLSGNGFNIYLEDQGDSYETSFFSTDGRTESVNNLLGCLKGLGCFEMELDSNLKEFSEIMSQFKDVSTYGCSLYKLNR